jgi:chromosome segregation ATPase
LDNRARELDAYARHLQQTRGTLVQYEHELAEAYQQFHAEYEQKTRETQALAAVAEKETSKIRSQQEPEKEALESALTMRKLIDADAAEATINQLRRDVEQARTDLTAQVTRQRDRGDKAEAQVDALRTDLTGIRDELRQREEILEHLRSELKQREEKLRAASASDDVAKLAPGRQQALIEKLLKDVAERDGRIRDLQHRLEKQQLPSAGGDEESYEAELNRYRVELEKDRMLLNEEIAHLDAMRAEVEEARRETELYLSRERKQLASERGEINRLREQLRSEQANQQTTDSGSTEPTAKAKQTKGETAESPPTAASPPDLIARLRLRNKNAPGRKP